jgi:hypothetical protein
MPYIEYPLGYIFLGRRAELDGSARTRLKRQLVGGSGRLDVRGNSNMRPNPSEQAEIFVTPLSQSNQIS